MELQALTRENGSLWRNADFPAGVQPGAEEPFSPRRAEEEDSVLLPPTSQQRSVEDEVMAKDEEAAFGAANASVDDRAPLHPEEVRAWAHRAGLSQGHATCLEHWVRVMSTLTQDVSIIGAICWIFIVFSARIFFTPLWTSIFIPVLSPLYGHGPSWEETKLRKTAILCHVAFGIGMLVCATLQFDQQARKRNFRRHKVSGYLYVIFGVGCVGALQPLRSATAKEQVCSVSESPISSTLCLHVPTQIQSCYDVLTCFTGVRHNVIR